MTDQSRSLYVVASDKPKIWVVRIWKDETGAPESRGWNANEAHGETYAKAEAIKAILLGARRIEVTLEFVDEYLGSISPIFR